MREGNLVVFETPDGGTLGGVTLVNASYVVTNVALNTFQVSSGGTVVTLGALVNTIRVRPAVVWATGDTSDKTFTVPIIDDRDIDPGQQFNVNLALETASDVIANLVGAGGAGGSSSQAKVTILDNDVAGGAQDITYSAGTSVNDLVRGVAVQDDARAVVVGHFTTFNGTARSRLARLNADGTLDTGFLSGLAGANSNLNAVAIDRNQNPLLTTNYGKIVIGGTFTNMNTTARTNVARLLTNGVVDTSFAPPVISGEVHAVAVQADGRVLVAGSFTVSGRQNLLRLDANGALDTTFLSSSPGANAEVRALLVQTDGKIVIGGDFTTFNGS